jgi:ubiquinone/menaquinone biosynthesis C-methylase UbiE
MNPKRIVAEGYDRIAEGLLARYRATPPSGRKQAYLERLIDGLDRDARVLDLGCGAGEQSAWLSNRVRVTGVDISRTQVALARDRAPDAAFLLADMCSLQFGSSSFDAIAAIYSIIHVPREEQEPLLRNLHSFLKPGGRLFAVFGTTDWVGTEDNWLDLGAEMYWSQFDSETSAAMLRAAGFRLIGSELVRDTLGEGAHLFVLAEKPA